MFEDTGTLCQRVNKQVGEVFSSPEAVMAKLIQNIFENKLQVGGALVPPLRPACHPANRNPAVSRWPCRIWFCSPLTVVVVLFCVSRPT